MIRRLVAGLALFLSGCLSAAEPPVAASAEDGSCRTVGFEGVDYRVCTVDLTRDRLGLAKVSLIDFDCDTYSATKVALAFSLPLIHDQAVVIFDDWGARSERNMIGQREAFQEDIAEPGVFTYEPLRPYNANSRVFLLTRVQPRT